MRNLFIYIKWLFSSCKAFSLSIILIALIGGGLSILSVVQALQSKHLIDSALKNPISTLYPIIILIALLLLSQLILRGVLSFFTTTTNCKLRDDIQRKLYNHILMGKWLETSKLHSVDLLTRMNNDVNSITTLVVTTIPQIFSLVVMLVSAFFALLYISKTMALVSIVIFPLLIFLSKFFSSKQKSYYVSLQKIEGMYNSFVQESFNNILIIKTFGVEKNKVDVLNKFHRDRLELSVKKSIYSSICNACLTLCSMSSFFIVFVWGAYTLSIGTLAFGTLTAMLQLFGNIQTPISGLASSYPQIIYAFGAIDRLMEIEGIICEHEVSIIHPCAISDNVVLDFNDVSFGYSNGNVILNNVSFKFGSGDIVGVVGRSGIGKTTLIRLILSLVSPDSGKITLNGAPLSTGCRELVSYVPQGNTLFSDSIFNNLTLGLNDFSMNDVNTALSLSHSFDFVQALDNGVWFNIGENGGGLSEGQCQRLCIARALLRKRPILILDEATSALDGETELGIINSIKGLEFSPLCFIITHRPAALEICSDIIEL